MQRIDDVGRKAFVKQKSEDVVAVVSGRLKSYLYFVFRSGKAAYGLQQYIKTICIVLDGEHICQDFALRADDEAVVLVLDDINTHANHNEYLRYVYLMLIPQNTLLL